MLSAMFQEIKSCSVVEVRNSVQKRGWNVQKTRQPPNF